MLYRIGTGKELDHLPNKLPSEVISAIQTEIALLDDIYGKERNYLESGGYLLLVESKEDLVELRSIIDYETHPVEWITRLETEHSYLSALFLMNDDFAITVYLPADIAPDILLSELVEFV